MKTATIATRTEQPSLSEACAARGHLCTTAVLLLHQIENEMSLKFAENCARELEREVHAARCIIAVRCSEEEEAALFCQLLLPPSLLLLRSRCPAGKGWLLS